MIKPAWRIQIQQIVPFFRFFKYFFRFANTQKFDPPLQQQQKHSFDWSLKQHLKQHQSQRSIWRWPAFVCDFRSFCINQSWSSQQNVQFWKLFKSGCRFFLLVPHFKWASLLPHHRRTPRYCETVLMIIIICEINYTTTYNLLLYVVYR